MSPKWQKKAGKLGRDKQAEGIWGKVEVEEPIKNL